jgi:hypothetical protein
MLQGLNKSVQNVVQFSRKVKEHFSHLWRQVSCVLRSRQRATPNSKSTEHFAFTTGTCTRLVAFCCSWLMEVHAAQNNSTTTGFCISPTATKTAPTCAPRLRQAIPTLLTADPRYTSQLNPTSFQLSSDLASCCRAFANACENVCKCKRRCVKGGYL